MTVSVRVVDICCEGGNVVFDGAPAEFGVERVWFVSSGDEKGRVELIHEDVIISRVFGDVGVEGGRSAGLEGDIPEGG